MPGRIIKIRRGLSRKPGGKIVSFRSAARARYRGAEHGQGAVAVILPPPTEQQRRTARRDFGKRLRAQRIASGFDSARSFAISIGLPEMTYGRYERGETEPVYAELLRLCRVLKTTPNFLLAGVPPGKEPDWIG